ncbi:hypothetical protein OK016_19330 [Vibrio chagasii]|nr:hypothetical protein [Vibrio chagasii]
MSADAAVTEGEAATSPSDGDTDELCGWRAGDGDATMVQSITIGLMARLSRNHGDLFQQVMTYVGGDTASA